MQFCYGAYDNTNTSSSGTATIAITNASVYEYDEPAASGTTAPTMPVTNTTPEAPPYSPPTALIGDNVELTSSYGCQTIQASTPPAVAASGYLQLVLTVAYSATAWANAYPEATLSLGRVTTTYTP